MPGPPRPSPKCTPIFRTFSSAAADRLEDWTATTSAIGTTPVARSSPPTFWGRPLSSTMKSAASRPSTGKPCSSVTVTGTSTKRDSASKRWSCPDRDTARTNKTAHRIRRIRCNPLAERAASFRKSRGIYSNWPVRSRVFPDRVALLRTGRRSSRRQCEGRRRALI
jgi:hypothetical protein